MVSLRSRRVKKSSFKGLIASGIHVAAIWRLLDHDANGDIKFVCGIGWENVRWQNPLRPNDQVYVWSKCLSKSETTSSERGVVIFDHGLKRKDELDILTFKGTCLVYKKISFIYVILKFQNLIKHYLQVYHHIDTQN